MARGLENSRALGGRRKASNARKSADGQKEGDDPFIRLKVNGAGLDGKPGEAEEAGGFFGTR